MFELRMLLSANVLHMEAAVAEKEEAGMSERHDDRLDELGKSVGYLNGRVEGLSERVDELGRRLDSLTSRVDKGFAEVNAQFASLHRMLFRVSVGAAVGVGIALVGAILT